MKYSLILTLLLSGYTHQAWAGDKPVDVLTQACHVQWLQYDWKMAEGALAKDNAAFNEGIKRVCQAKAELYMEGYEVQPSIAEEDQEEVFRLVFLPSVELIKTQMKVYLPKLRVL